ncbi:MAG: MFS transporter [Bacteroidota bacterium]
MSDLYSRNVRVLLAMKFFKWFLLYMPIIVLYYLENGLSVTQVMLLQSVHSITVMVLEIPSGYFSDRLGRRPTLILGMLLNLIGVILLALGYNFATFSLGVIAFGIGNSFLSGTDSAMLYESLVLSNRSNEYLKYEGRVYSISTFSEAIAALFGGYMAFHLGYHSTVHYQIILAAIGLLLAFWLVETPPPEDDGFSEWERIKHIINRVFRKDKLLRAAVFLSAFFGAATLNMAWFAQPYLEFRAFEDDEIGLFWAFFNLTVAFFSFTSHRFAQFIPRYLMISGCILGIFVGYLGLSLGNTLIGLSTMWIIYAVRGLLTPVMKDLINQLAPPETRATVFSIRGFIIRSLFGLFAPFLGWYTDTFSLLEAFMVAAFSFLGFLSLTGIAYYIIQKKNQQ